MSDGCCGCCRGQEEENQQILKNRNNWKEPVTTQPRSAQKYVAETSELRESEKSSPDQILLEKNDLQKRLENQSKRHQDEVKNYQTDIVKLKDKINTLESKNSELLSRLSALASANLSDNHPNIADLSDENRPTKLAEQFSELYDNEWTDAMEVLASKQNNENKEKEREACEKLFKVVTTTYATCHEKANNDLTQIEQVISKFNGKGVPSTEVLKTLKDERRKHYIGTLKQVKEDCFSSLKDIITTEEASLITKFLEKCVSVCWLMVIQDPPVFMDIKADLHDKPLSTNIYKHYTHSGETIDYVVWPVLYLCQGGNILSKGVAQGMKVDADDIDLVTRL